MASQKTPVTEADAEAAVETLRRYRENKGATFKEVRIASQVLARYVRATERGVTAKRRSLKAQGIDVDKEIDKEIVRLLRDDA